MSDDVVSDFIAQKEQQAQRADEHRASVLRAASATVLAPHELTNSAEVAEAIRADRRERHEEYFAPDAVAARRAEADRLKVYEESVSNQPGLLPHTAQLFGNGLLRGSGVDSRVDEAREYEETRHRRWERPDDDGEQKSGESAGTPNPPPPAARLRRRGQ
jgi:hypothetical protein